MNPTSLQTLAMATAHQLQVRPSHSSNVLMCKGRSAKARYLARPSASVKGWPGS